MSKKISFTHAFVFLDNVLIRAGAGNSLLPFPPFTRVFQYFTNKPPIGGKTGSASAGKP
jgi:hypothetical protein